MLSQQNQVLSRIEPDGQGGTQFLYRVNDYGIAAVTSPQEDVAHIHWRVDVIKYKNNDTLQYDLCHTTELAGKSLTFRNDKSVNEFLEKAFVFFQNYRIWKICSKNDPLIRLDEKATQDPSGYL